MRAYIITVPSRARAVSRLVSQLLSLREVSNVSLSVDQGHKGCWWNTSQALARVVESGEPGLMMPDDVILRTPLIQRHLPDIFPHLARYGLVSMFTPPRKSMTEWRDQGFNGVEGNDFMWPHLFLITPEFAAQTIAADALMDQVKVGYHDEVRFRFSSQLNDVDMLTLLGSFANHDLNLPSLLGTAASLGGNLRDTRIYATMEDDFRQLNLKQSRHKRDLAEYRA